MKHNTGWALVLSGGGARGFAHIGFIKKLEEEGFPRPSLIAGTSMGAIIGGLYASGISTEELERFVREEFKISDYLESFVFKLEGPMGQIMQTGQVLASIATKQGVDKGEKALELFESLTGGKNFDDTEIPFRCNAVDLLSGKEAVFSSGSVAGAIRASMSFPLFFEPYKIGEKYFVDGGLINNLPITIAREEGFKHILAVDVNHFSSVSLKELRGAYQVIYRSIECALLGKGDVKKTKHELVLNISDDAAPFSFYRKKELLKLGEDAVNKNRELLEKFFKPIFHRNKAGMPV